MNDNSQNPARLIYAIEILLAQLDASLSPQMTEGDSRADSLKKRIGGFKDQTARLKSVLRKHQDAQRRKRMLDKQNRQNTRRQKNG
jgi:t-SNARE complex subunit (syntaxin)